jgi:hypothetical protein
MKLPNLSIAILKDALKSSLQRFPFALLSAFGFTLITIYLIEMGDK